MVAEAQDALVTAFKAGFAGVLSRAQLASLAEACERDDERLTQGRTVFPPSFSENGNRPVEQCCAGAFALGVATGGVTVSEVLEAFYAGMGNRGDDGGDARWDFTHHWDSLPRAAALGATARACRELLAESECAA